MQIMHSAQWKSAERKLASLVGGKRIPVNGRGDQPDIEHPRWSIEVKHRQLPQWLKYAVSQAVRVCTPGKKPIAIVHQPGTDYLDSVVLIRLGDFLESELFSFEFKEDTTLEEAEALDKLLDGLD